MKKQMKKLLYKNRRKIYSALLSEADNFRLFAKKYKESEEKWILDAENNEKLANEILTMLSIEK